MESSRVCKSCSKRALVPDDVTGNMVCSSCGVVQDYDNFQAHIGGITGDTGTYVRVGTAGSGNVYNYKESKIYEALKLIEDFMLKLGLSGSKSHEVKQMVAKITDGEYGQGMWFPVFVGACTYVVMRKDQRKGQKVLSMVEVADLVGCDVYELGRMISRVLDFNDEKIPEFDIVNSYKHALESCPSFSEVSKDVKQRMSQQGVFLVQCLIKWFVTTGRQPMPVVAAVLIFVAELNKVNVKIEDVAKELHVAITTCRRRHKELLERLVEVARVLPWGKDVSVKNIMMNAPSVIQYMEMKSMTKCGGKRNSFEHALSDVEGLVDQCLSSKDGYGLDCYHIDGNGSQYFELEQATNVGNDHPDSQYSALERPTDVGRDYPDRFQISPESLSMIYSNYLNEISSIKAAGEIGIGNNRKRQHGFDLQECTEWWKGNSNLSKNLCLKEILKKEVGLDATPPSFDKARSDNKKRQKKINAAKLRIQRIMNPKLAVSDFSNDIYMHEPEKPKKKRKKVQVDIDWEDLIIETLLLHNVKEDEIENGHYNVLFALHVFNDCNS